MGDSDPVTEFAGLDGDGEAVLERFAAFAVAVLAEHRPVPMPAGLVDRCTCDRWASRCEVRRLARQFLIDWPVTGKPIPAPR